MIYVSAVYANAEHTLVIGTDALGNTETVPADYTLFRQPEHGPIGFTANGGVIGDYVAPETPLAPPHLNNGGLARFSGASPVVVYEAVRIAGVTRISKGRYRVTHETAMPSDQYSAFPSVFDPLPRTIRITARTASYVEVRVTDLAGAVQDPTEASIKTERVVIPS